MKHEKENKCNSIVTLPKHWNIVMASVKWGNSSEVFLTTAQNARAYECILHSWCKLFWENEVKQTRNYFRETFLCLNRLSSHMVQFWLWSHRCGKWAANTFERAIFFSFAMFFNCTYCMDGEPITTWIVKHIIVACQPTLCFGRVTSSNMKNESQKQILVYFTLFSPKQTDAMNNSIFH